MAFTLPTFNVSYNLWRAANYPPVGPPDASGLCNFSLGKRIVTGTDGFAVTRADPAQGTGIDVFLRIMMVPAGVDIRGRWQGGVNSQDEVEIPAGSGAFYVVADVADMAKGFPNEHRVAWVFPDSGIPLPSPLP